MKRIAKSRKKRRRYLSEIRVKLSRVKKGEKAVPLDYPDHLGLRTKLGGKPDWEQGDEYPNCPDCKEEMVFIAQIDSIEHESEYNPLSKSALGHQDYMFCDVGMIYVFYCFGCNEAKAVTQFY